MNNGKLTLLSRPGSRTSANRRETTEMMQQDMDELTAKLGFLCRTWRRIRRKKHTEAISVMAKMNYKIYANIGFTRRSTQRYVVLLDTGDGSSFIRKEFIPTNMWNRIKPSCNLNVHTSGNISLAVEVGNRVEILNFNFVDRLAANIYY